MGENFGIQKRQKPQKRQKFFTHRLLIRCLCNLLKLYVSLGTFVVSACETRLCLLFQFKRYGGADVCRGGAYIGFEPARLGNP